MDFLFLGGVGVGYVWDDGTVAGGAVDFFVSSDHVLDYSYFWERKLVERNECLWRKRE